MSARFAVVLLANLLAALSLGGPPASSIAAHAAVLAHSTRLVSPSDSGLAPSRPESEWPPHFISTWGAFGTAEGEFEDTASVAVDSAGSVYVADRANHRVQKFDRSGNFLRTWGYGVQNGSASFQICTSGCQKGILGSGNGQFGNIMHLAVDASDIVHVSDGSYSRIQRFDTNGNYLSQWGTTGTGAGSLILPLDIVFDAAGYIYVTEAAGHRVQKFDGNGTFQRMWGWGVDTGANAFEICTATCQQGAPGDAAGQFNYPFGVAVDLEGNVYVVDSNNHRINKFTTDGDFVETWGWGVQNGVSEFQACSSGCQAGVSGSGDSQLALPSGLDVDTLGHLYVADTNNHRVQKLDGEGGLLTKWGQFGTGDGEFSLLSDVLAIGNGNIYVCDQHNDRMQRFATPVLEHFIAGIVTAQGEANREAQSSGPAGAAPHR